MSVYEKVLEFKKKYPGTVAWRLKKNANIVDKHLNSDEKLLYVFAGQKNDNPFNIITSAVIALTNKRILIGRDRVVVGYFLDSITPDMFNDIKVRSNIIWGSVDIDTIKEFFTITNISKRALVEIETNISEYMMEMKKEYSSANRK